MKTRFHPLTILVLAALLLPRSVAGQSNFNQGKILEKINSGGYSYLRVQTGQKTLWLAAPMTEIETGEPVLFSPGMLMENFTSPSLNRTFPQIYFTGTVLRPGEQKATGFSHNRSSMKQIPTEDMLHSVTPLEDGLSIRELIAQKEDLNGQVVTIRGLVTKFNASIMNRNWLHLRDASTGPDGKDLVVTTDETFEVGETVVLTGVVQIDQDFGFGYSYELLLTQAHRRP
ncbi:MAG: hypothetical protein D6762_09655 [Candidatus Neomarinimicrobiota bacterium]|nr:MAG: hypothetical protein D6762_09655 [Candidatus Neomarinimicrobiota bacterium]